MQHPDSGSLINALDLHERTPLYWAAHNGRLSLCQALCHTGADVSRGKSPMVGALTFGHADILRYLHQPVGTKLHPLSQQTRYLALSKRRKLKPLRQLRQMN